MILSVPSQIARTQGSDAVIYYQVDQQTIADYPRGGAAASPTYRYFWASYIDQLIARKATGSGGELLFAHRNQQYSILSLSDSSGAVVERVAYQAYGQPTFTNSSGTTLSTSAKATRYTYTGCEWDPSLQLHYFRARWMSGLSGRFSGRDPIGFDGSEWNTYEFLQSSPNINLDFSGLGCRICTTLDSISEVKDSNGVIVACALNYVFDKSHAPQSYNGGLCRPECEQVLGCVDMPDMTGKVIKKLKSRSQRDFLF